MDQQEQNKKTFEKKMNDLKDRFQNNGSGVDLNSTMNLLNEMKGILKAELANNNIHNAEQMKQFLSKHVPMNETQRMMQTLSKFYQSK